MRNDHRDQVQPGSDLDIAINRALVEAELRPSESLAPQTALVVEVAEPFAVDVGGGAGALDDGD